MEPLSIIFTIVCIYIGIGVIIWHIMVAREICKHYNWHPVNRLRSGIRSIRNCFIRK